MNQTVFFAVVVLGVIRMTKGSCSTLMNCMKRNNPEFGSDMTDSDMNLNDADSFGKGWKNICRYALEDCFYNHTGCPQVYSFLSPYLPKEQLASARGFFCLQIIDIKDDVIVDLQRCLNKVDVLVKIGSDCLKDTYCKNLECSKKVVNEDCSSNVYLFYLKSWKMCGIGSKADMELVVLLGLFIVSWLLKTL